MLRAQALRQETAVNSISPERAGSIMYDTLAYINQMQLQGANPLLISKIYASVEAMEADSAPVSDLTGQPLRPGQVVCIADPSDPDDPDTGLIYRYDGAEGGASSWTAVGRIGSDPYLEGYQYMGVAKLTPAETDPGTPTQKVFYLASEPGTYTNFDNLVVADGEVAVLKYNGSWSKDTTGAATAASVSQLGQEVENDAFNFGLSTRQNTISFAVGDSYLWKVLFEQKLVLGTHYRLNIQANSPSEILFALGTQSTMNVQEIIRTTTSTIVDFSPNSADMILRARCSGTLAATTGDISVTLTNLDGKVNTIADNLNNLRKTTIGDGLLQPFFVRKFGLVLNGPGGSGRWQTKAVNSQYHKGAYHYSYIYDVSQFAGRTLFCYSHQVTDVAIYAFIKDYTAIKATYDAEAWATNVVEVVRGSDSIGSVISITVPNGANQLVLCGSDTDESAATLTIPNLFGELIDKVHELDPKVMELFYEVFGPILLTPIEVKDNRAIGSNPSAATYGILTTFNFVDYADVRPTPVAGTKYVSKIYDTRLFIGKELNFHFAPRNNIYGVAFVSDYHLIPTSSDTTTWESIYKGGQLSYGEIASQDCKLIVPAGGNYCVVTGTDLDPATAMTWIGLKEDMEKVKQAEGIDTTSIVALNNEVETSRKINNAKRVGRSGATQSGIPPLMLLHFSDIHGATANLARIKEFFDYYQASIDGVICTGDMVSSNITDGMSFWANANVENFMMCIGNHDAYADSSHAEADPHDVYNLFIKPYVVGWNVVQPANAEANALCYYYKDYADSHIRLIILDNYPKGVVNYIENENTWLAGVLADARANNLSVLIAVHPCTGDVTGFKCAFNAIQKGYSTAGIYTMFKDSVDDFINAGGDFIAWFGGHGHIDVCGTVEDYPNQTIIAIDAANRASGNTYSDTARPNEQKDRAFDCFNLMAIDPYQKVIKLIRIGANMDSWLRKKDVISIQYATSDANPISGPTVINPYD